MIKKRKPTHPGSILEEDYIKPLNLNLDKLADRLGIARNTLYKVRSGEARITPALALSLSEAFDTTPQLWLNLQQKYDLWMAEHEHIRVAPIIKDGLLIPVKQNVALTRAHV